MPRGEAFKSFAEWMDLIVGKHQDDVVLGQMKNLLLYATGREADVESLVELCAILKPQSPGGYRQRDLIKATVRSRAFLEP
jgi:hypothetical protein